MPFQASVSQDIPPTPSSSKLTSSAQTSDSTNPEHVQSLRRSVRVIKTRSMTSTNTSNPRVAFGGTIPFKRAIKSLPKNKTKNGSTVNPEPRVCGAPDAPEQTATDQHPRTGRRGRPTVGRTQRIGRPKQGTTSVAKMRKNANCQVQDENEPYANSEPIYALPATSNSSKPTVLVPSEPSSIQTLQNATLNTKDRQLARSTTLAPITSTIQAELLNLADSSVIDQSYKPQRDVPSSVSDQQLRVVVPLDPPVPPTSPSPPNHKGKKSNKRLFEDTDYGSRDIFSFLDRKPSERNTVGRSGTRAVFKPQQQPLVKINRLPADPSTPNNKKRRMLASKKLLAGVPMVDLHVPSSGASTSTHTVKPVTTLVDIPCAPHVTHESQSDSNSEAEQPAETFKTSDMPSSTHVSTTRIKIRIHDPNFPSQEENDRQLERHALQPIPPQPLNDRLPNGCEDDTISTSANTLAASCSILLAPQQSSANHDFSQTQVKEPPKSPSSHSSTDPLEAEALFRRSEAYSTVESSTDDIDFLSPKKKNKLLEGVMPPPAGYLRFDIAPKSSGLTCAIEPSLQKGNGESSRISSPTTCAEPAQSLGANKNCETAKANNVPPHPVAHSVHDVVPQSLSPETAGKVIETKTQGVVSTETFETDSDSPLTPLSSSQDSNLDDMEPEIEDASTTPLSSPSKLDHSPSPSTGAAQPSMNVTPDSKRTNTEAQPSPKSSPRLIPTRISPIKQPTLPTSIPILSRTLPKSAPLTKLNALQTSELISNPIPRPIKPLTHPQRRPSMLPRRTLTPSMGPSQMVAFNVVPSLDAIVENSPEKRATRDAVSAGSLNLSRGPGLPPRMIFSGGIKTKAASTFSRAVAEKLIPTRPIPDPVLENSVNAPDRIEDPVPAPAPADDTCAGVAMEDEETCADVSNLSETSQSSTLSSISLTSSSSGNISLDTQERLTKLQAMLTKLGGSRPVEPSKMLGNHSSSSSSGTSQDHCEYEVPLNDEDDSQDPPGRYNLKKRASSVSHVPRPVNTKSIGHSHGETQGNAYKARKTDRRASSILPRARVDSDEEDLVDNPKANDQTLQLGRSQRGLSRSERSQRSTPLKDVVAYVDVRTAEGDDAGKIFVEMLKALGAKVVGRPVFPLTHIVFKAGKQATIDRWLIHPQPKPFLVGIGWIVRCREILGKADEALYTIDVNSNHVQSSEPVNLKASVSAVGGGHRRKSMEPKALALLNSGLQLASGQDNPRTNLSRSCIGDSTIAAPVDPKSILAESLARARRKSLQFLPKVGSPLASKVFTITDENPKPTS